MTDPSVIIPEALPLSNNEEISSDLDDEDIVDESLDSKDYLLENIPAMVSITRVPKPRPQTGSEVRPSIHVKGGPPPPLLRVGGTQANGLPPMPRLRLGGVRGTGPARPSVPRHPLNGMANLMQSHMSLADSLLVNGASVGQPRIGLPVISRTVSLHSLKNRPDVRTPILPGVQPATRQGTSSALPLNSRQNSQGLRQGIIGRPVNTGQLASSTHLKQGMRPGLQSGQPVHVRTVFVPPPLNMDGKGNAVNQNGIVVKNNAPITIPQSNAGITITPLSNGKASSLLKPMKEEDLYDDVDIDDDGIDEDDDEYNEITEAPSSTGTVLPIKNLLEDGATVSGSVTLHRLLNRKEDTQNSVKKTSQDANRRNSVDSVGSSSTAASVDSLGQPKPATARKSFKPLAATDLEVQAGLKSEGLKRRSDSLGSEGSCKKLRTDSVEELVPASFGHHFMSSLISMRGDGPADGVNKNIEDNASSSVILKAICTCEVESIAVSGKEGMVCQGVEVFGGYRVGCKNKVNRSEIVKTSPENDPVILCDLHRDRLFSHCCCPICGEFCSHGLVFMCRINKSSPPHLFHRFCYQSKPKEERCCPHCSSKRPPLAVQLKMTMTRTPLKILNYTSKISTVKVNCVETEKWEIGKKREKILSYTLPNGKIVSAEGLPKGLERNKLDEILTELKNKALVKHTTRNMYQPTAAGDNVKLLQLLALDYSPKQRFSECNDGTPLHVAATNNHVLTCHILSQAGAEINALDGSNETPLMIACKKGFSDVVRYLLNAGARPDLAGDDGMTALHFATQSGHLECAHVILSQNKLPRNFINVKDDGGWTPLVWACEHKHEQVIRYLVEQGADPFVKDVEMNISLHWAAFSGSRAITELLLSAGCNVNQANAIGETPLHIALRQDHYECALLLIARGARLDLPNSQGQVPSSCMSGENPKIESMIQLGTTLHKLMKERQQKFLTERTVIQDISNGKENIPISAVNGEDFENGPSGYTYVKSPVVTGNVPINRDISTLQHCKCTNNCISEESCRCSDISTKSWYDQNGILKDGFDFHEPPMIFECNELCECNQNSCNNRVVQHGITARIQIYKTYGMGWGAKSMVDIPKGGFVCEYVGEIISDAQAEQRENDSYLFDLENREGETFCLDANKFGNVARFINHSCTPNLVPVKVFTSHQDLRFPHIALFASKAIKKGDVLGFDYGEKFWVIKHKFFTCWCGGDKCKYSKHSIGKTLNDYYRKLEENSKYPEEEHKQTGKLKLKLRMEEGKVVKVDDSGLLPDEPDLKEGRKSPKTDIKRSPKREEKDQKSCKNDASKEVSQDQKDKDVKKSPKHTSKKSPKQTESLNSFTHLKGADVESISEKDTNKDCKLSPNSLILDEKDIELENESEKLEVIANPLNVEEASEQKVLVFKEEFMNDTKLNATLPSPLPQADATFQNEKFKTDDSNDLPMQEDDENLSPHTTSQSNEDSEQTEDSIEVDPKILENASSVLSLNSDTQIGTRKDPSVQNYCTDNNIDSNVNETEGHQYVHKEEDTIVGSAPVSLKENFSPAKHDKLDKNAINDGCSTAMEVVNNSTLEATDVTESKRRDDGELSSCNLNTDKQTEDSSFNEFVSEAVSSNASLLANSSKRTRGRPKKPPSPKKIVGLGKSSSDKDKTINSELPLSSVESNGRPKRTRKGCIDKD